MGYITTVLTPEERRKAGPKNGAQATATVAVDPVGAVTVHVASVPQGQGHRTVLAQVVADALGLEADGHPRRHRAGHRAGRLVDRVRQLLQPVRRRRSRGAAHLAAEQLKEKLARIAAAQLNVPAEEIEFAHGKIVRAAIRTTPCRSRRLAAASHWAPGAIPDGAQALRETVFWTPPQLTAPTEDDEINSSLCHGFIFDFCGVEIDRVTGAVRIDKYVTMHDCGRVLHPGMVAGQITGGFAQRSAPRCTRNTPMRAGRQLPVRHLRRLSGADHHRGAGAGDPARRDAVAVHAARRQGRGRGQLHEHAGLHRQRGRRCARRRRTSICR